MHKVKIWLMVIIYGLLLNLPAYAFFRPDKMRQQIAYFDELAKKQQYQEAETGYQRLLDQRLNRKQRVYILKQLILIAKENTQSEKAISFYHQILSFDPHNYPAMIELARLYQHLELYEQALQLYSPLLQKSSFRFPAILGRSEIYLNQGMVEEAINDLRQALSLQPENTDVYYNLYRAYRQKGDLAMATRLLEQVAGANPGENYQPELAELYWQQQRYPEAVKLYQNLAATFPEEGYWRLAEGLTYFLAGETQLAEDILSGCLGFDQEDISLVARFYLARLAIQKQDSRKARDIFRALQREGYTGFTGVCIDLLGKFLEETGGTNKQ